LSTGPAYARASLADAKQKHKILFPVKILRSGERFKTCSKINSTCVQCNCHAEK
jgi:hypothetical protein